MVWVDHTGQRKWIGDVHIVKLVVKGTGGGLGTTRFLGQRQTKRGEKGRKRDDKRTIEQV